MKVLQLKHKSGNKRKKDESTDDEEEPDKKKAKKEPVNMASDEKAKLASQWLMLLHGHSAPPQCAPSSPTTSVDTKELDKLKQMQAVAEYKAKQTVHDVAQRRADDEAQFFKAK